FSSVICDIHDLYSFPTRRSSDLQLYCFYYSILPSHLNTEFILAFALTVFLGLISTKQSSSSSSIILNSQTFNTCSSNLEYLFSKDRKSTRLNSSHVSISYAVFCL